MSKQMEMMKQSMELLQTMEQALNHVHRKLKEGECEATYPIFGDVIESYSSIENAVNQLPKEWLLLKNTDLSKKLRRAFDRTVGYYESDHYAKIIEVMQFTLIPSFNRWKRALDREFGRYLVS